MASFYTGGLFKNLKAMSNETIFNISIDVLFTALLIPFFIGMYKTINGSLKVLENKKQIIMGETLMLLTEK